MINSLHWVLLGLALLVLAGIYLFWNKRPVGRRRKKPEHSFRREPVIHPEEPQAPVPTPPAPETSVRPAMADTKIIALRVAAKPGKTLDGEMVSTQFEALNIRFGRYNIFHRHAGKDDASDPVFSVADMVEPGSFPSADLAGRSLTGLSFFQQLPGPIDGVQAFNELLDAARDFADVLGADLLDASGSTVTRQTAAHMRDEVVQWLQRRASASIPTSR
jgi:cell division protein ZipA